MSRCVPYICYTPQEPQCLDGGRGAGGGGRAAKPQHEIPTTPPLRTRAAAAAVAAAAATATEQPTDKEQLTSASTISPSSLSRVCLSSETAFLRPASSSRTKDWNFSSPFILDRTFSSRIRRKSAYVFSREVCRGVAITAGWED